MSASREWVDGIAAIKRAPEDFRTWLLLGLVESALGDPGPGISYTLRAQTLAPRVISRLGNLGLSAAGSGI